MTALGGIALIAMGHARWEAPFGVILGAALAWFFFHWLRPDDPKLGGLLEVFSTTHLMLAAFFIATDSASSPANSVPRLLFGLGIGLMYMLIRVFGTWMDPMPFAIVLMNILNPLLDKLRPKPLMVVIQNG
jgi:electron transport complex protein RnfD